MSIVAMKILLSDAARMSIQVLQARWSSLDSGISSTMAAVRALVRGIPLLWSERPGTPLRVLCLMAFDMHHRIRHARPLSKSTLKLLALLLDSGACANAAFDGKTRCLPERRRIVRSLSQSGVRPTVVNYLRRLRDIERNRPLPGGDSVQFDRVRRYREAVVRLSLGMLASIADGKLSLDEGIRVTESDPDFNLLFRLAMLCQIIDDVLDYSKDLAAGLPGFLTAVKSQVEACEFTRLTARDYAGGQDVETGGAFPLCCAICLVSILTQAVIALMGPGRRTSMQIAEAGKAMASGAASAP